MYVARAIDPDSKFLSMTDYLEEEQEALERHEYVDGQVFAMAGASEIHEIVALNLAASLLTHLRGKKCRVFKGGMKVHLQLNRQELFYYPDIMVVCDPSDQQALFKEKPKVIIEVMSDYRKDHVEKLFAYQQIASLEEYLVISQEPKEPEAWLYRKDQDWAKTEGAPEGRIRLETLGFETALEDLYVME